LLLEPALGALLLEPALGALLLESALGALLLDDDEELDSLLLAELPDRFDGPE
jgi:hypothetical protein